jgi:hypothetical protein
MVAIGKRLASEQQQGMALEGVTNGREGAAPSIAGEVEPADLDAEPRMERGNVKLGHGPALPVAIACLEG